MKGRGLWEEVEVEVEEESENEAQVVGLFARGDVPGLLQTGSEDA